MEKYSYRGFDNAKKKAMVFLLASTSRKLFNTFVSAKPTPFRIIQVTRVSGSTRSPIMGPLTRTVDDAPEGGPTKSMMTGAFALHIL